MVFTDGVGSCEGAAAGSFFGPATFFGGALAGGLTAVAVAAYMRDQVREYSVSCGTSNMPAEYSPRPCGTSRGKVSDYSIPCGGGRGLNMLPEELLPCGTSYKVPEYSMSCETSNVFPDYSLLPCGTSNKVPGYSTSCGTSSVFPEYSIPCAGPNTNNFVLKNANAVQQTKPTHVAPGKSTEKDVSKRPIYKDGAYHHPNSKGSGKGGKSRAPSDGQKALDNSVPIKDTNDNRVGISNGEIVKLNKTLNGEYHGYVVSWEDAHSSVQNALKKHGLVNSNGKIK